MKKNLSYLLVTFVYFIFFLLMLVLLTITFRFRKISTLIELLSKLTEFAKKTIYEKN